MVPKVAILNAILQRANEFEKVFCKARKIISFMRRYFHQLQKYIKKQAQGLFPVNRDNLKAQSENFKTSAKYQQWKPLLHFYTLFQKLNIMVKF